MKKKFFIILFIALITPFMVQGVDFPNPLKSDNFWCMIDGVIDFIFKVSIPLGFIMYVIAGYFFVTCLGEAEKISRAKKIVLWTTIGLLIVFCAKGIILLILEFIGSSMGPLNC